MKIFAFALLVIGAVVGQDLKEYQDSNHKFASDVYTEFAKNNHENFLISPFSVQTISSLAAIGSKGETAKQFTAALRIPSDPSKIENLFQQISPYIEINKDYELTSANKIYVGKGLPLKDDFKAIAQNTFKSDIQNINFSNKEEASNEINAWIESKTHNKIKNLINKDMIESSTAAILVNTLYFKGEWVDKFGKAYPQKFYTTKTEFVNTDMLEQRNNYNYHYNKELNAEFLEIPFKGGDVTMTIALPKEIDGLSRLEKSIPTVLSVQPYETYDAIIAFPKFTMETDIDFKSILEGLGATLPFSVGANFNGISDVPLVIDKVAQKTFIEITETGATAAAATTTSFMVVSMPRVTFYANRPFIYYLRHKVHGVLFVGRYTKP